MTKHPKIIESNQYHVWSDALHGRALAHQARNKWDCGTYVHWCITSACTALDVACQDATQEPRIGYSFQKDLKKAVANLGLPPLDWGSGVWQRVVALREHRKDYIHRIGQQADLFPNASVADWAIDMVRRAIKAIYQHVDKSAPAWIEDDDDRGWDRGRGSTVNVTAIRAGADPEDPDSIRICYVDGGREYNSDILPPGSPWREKLDELIHNLNIPVSEVRAYRGKELLEVRPLSMRGD